MAPAAIIMSGKTGTTASNRACDRCRRRKAKCDFANSSCTRCDSAGLRCTFDLPVQRRGPKTRYPVTPPPIPTTATASRTLPSQAAATDLPLSDPTWDTDALQGLDDISPAQPAVLESPLLDPESSGLSSTFKLWTSLAAQIGSILPTLTLEELVRRCFDLYFEYLFPLAPLVHEQNLRNNLDSFLAGDIPILHSGGHSTDPASASISENLEVWAESTFTLITALCAEVAFRLPTDIFAEGCIVSDIFLKASRNCLNIYLETDLEYPNATSMIIRYYHYNCLHATRKPNYAWHVFGEATRLAQVMRLNEEASYESLSPLEAELRRRAFWVIFIGDKSAAILDNRPITIHQLSFETGITAAYPIGEIDDGISMIPATIDPSRPDFVAGFSASIKLWQVASDILLEIRLQEHARNTRKSYSLSPNETSSPTLDALYVRFITCLDNLPPYLQVDGFAENEVDYQQSNKTGIIQRVNLHITFHFLRMIILQKLAVLEAESPYKSNSRMLMVRRAEVAHDMLRIIHSVPFWALQINGESCVLAPQNIKLNRGNVEKIRLVGASLVGVLHESVNGATTDAPLLTRARTDFAMLLEALTGLDYRAADTIRYGLEI
ncbi:fungal-specific transcription factor domain-containing protein [Talaromyces proteolyticus]|uniref:Fungal-specific transcription factor domain-containing protein n=1 Tax=Talaromyces proteolyticus TaxID=1131652 RepID=A0AAD4PV11_9EURO|nr:fungal-specific transcription factor domain-containing protein [Talaromyces proteolyticus]KAH8695975.1 fungal-specific transcription factor domain-containing protein [Talaromyces proteolyticus]